MFNLGKKEEKRQQAELEKDAKAFNLEMGALLSKYKLQFVPALQFSPNGVLPVINISRAQPVPEQPKEEAKA